MEKKIHVHNSRCKNPCFKNFAYDMVVVEIIGCVGGIVAYFSSSNVSILDAIIGSQAIVGFIFCLSFISFK